jgi:hypothetical protein
VRSERGGFEIFMMSSLLCFYASRNDI